MPIDPLPIYCICYDRIPKIIPESSNAMPSIFEIAKSFHRTRIDVIWIAELRVVVNCYNISIEYKLAHAQLPETI